MNYTDGKYDGNDVSDSTLNWLELAVGTRIPLTEVISGGIEIDYKLVGTNTPADLGVGVMIGYKFMK